MVCLAAVALLLTPWMGAAPLRAITIEFDYRYDTAGFFGTATTPTPARMALEFAARTFTSFTDSLEAIQPGGGNAWTAVFTNPATGQTQSLVNLAIPFGTVKVFAATRDLPGATVAEAGPGFFQNPTGSLSFLNAVVNRGQGSNANDFGPWGGFISFDTQQADGGARQWSFDVDDEPPANAYDFYTTAVHELSHVLGFGTSTAFSNKVLTTSAGEQTTYHFTGDTAEQLYQNPVPLYRDLNNPLAHPQHFGLGVTSPPFLGDQPIPSLGPFLSAGWRKLFTPLDYAVMADIGWSVPDALLALPGDVDQDYDVDGADLLIWQRGFGGLAGASGDVNGDLKVDSYDGWILRNYFGTQAYNLNIAPAAGGVPEPSAGLVAALAGAAMFIARRRMAAAASPAR